MATLSGYREIANRNQDHLPWGLLSKSLSEIVSVGTKNFALKAMPDANILHRINLGSQFPRLEGEPIINEEFQIHSGELDLQTGPWQAVLKNEDLIS